MIDRLMQDRIYEFLVYSLPCSFPTDMSDVARQLRKRKLSSEDYDNSQLSCSTPNSAIILTAHSPVNDSSLSPMLKGLLHSSSKMSIGRSSTTLRPFSTINNLSSAESSKLPKIGRPPKSSRPRSKSTTSSLDQKLKGNSNLLRNRSLSGGDHIIFNHTAAHSSPDNTNCNNSNEASPNTLLAIVNCQSQIPALLPITPPKNPYENPNQISDPKIRKKLNL